MKLDFSTMPEVVVPHFKGGKGEAHIRKLADERMGTIVTLTLPVGSTIGNHIHEGNCEIIQVISGTGICMDDGNQYRIVPGDYTYCPEGHSHGIVNDGTEPLVLFGVLPDVK